MVVIIKDITVLLPIIASFVPPFEDARTGIPYENDSIKTLGNGSCQTAG